MTETKTQDWRFGWVMCVLGSTTALVRIAREWHRWDSSGRFVAACLTAVLLIVPVTLILRVANQKSISTGWLFGWAYMLLSLAVLTFGVNLR